VQCSRPFNRLSVRKGLTLNYYFLNHKLQPVAFSVLAVYFGLVRLAYAVELVFKHRYCIYKRSRIVLGTIMGEVLERKEAETNCNTVRSKHIRG